MLLGGHIVFVAQREDTNGDGSASDFDNGRIVTLDLQTGETRDLTDGSVNDWGPAWSPDGALIAYVSEGVTIEVIPPHGSERQTVAGWGQILTPTSSTRLVFDPTWTTDSRYVIYADMYEGCGMMCYFENYVKRLEPASGQTDILLEDSGYGVSWLWPTVWSAVDNRLAYIGGDSRLYTRDISAALPGEIQQLTFREAINGEPAQVLEAGQSFFEPMGSVHSTSANASDTEPAVISVVILGKPGEALSKPAAKPGAD